MAGRASLTAALLAGLFSGASTSAQAPAAGFPQLVDITAATGIHFNHLSTPDQRYIVESMSGGVALIDYDGDGYPDIYLTNAPSVEMALAGKKARSALYHNNHDGSFTDVTDKAGVATPCWAMGAAVGDYNNDGLPDLLVTCFGGVVLYRNNGDGTFSDVTKPAGLDGDHAWATGASFGDADNDGWPDMFIAHYVDFNLNDLPKFGSSVTCQYHSVAVQCGPRGLKGSPDLLFHNNHDGTFKDVSKQSATGDPKGFFGLTAIWSDIDGRGHPDLFVANDGEPNFLYRSDRTGLFKDVAEESGAAVNQDGVEQANMGVAVGDYNHTGRMSFAVSHFSDEYTTLFRNDGNLSFTDVSAAAGTSVPTRHFVGWGDAFVDLDNDGWLDFFQVNGHVYPQVNTTGAGAKYREPAVVLANTHDGKFKDVSQLVGKSAQLPQVSRGLAVGDLFNDGHMELVIENLEGSPMILRPEGGPRNHWISLTLKGGGGNRLALNARVRVTVGAMVQTGEIESGGSYISQNDLRLHFGLGSSDHADKIEIFWPSGVTETLAQLAGDRFYTITEGNSTPISQPPNTTAPIVPTATRSTH